MLKGFPTPAHPPHCSQTTLNIGLPAELDWCILVPNCYIHYLIAYFSFWSNLCITLRGLGVCMCVCVCAYNATITGYFHLIGLKKYWTKYYI